MSADRQFDDLCETLRADGWRAVTASSVPHALAFTHPHKPGAIIVPYPSAYPLSPRAEASILRQAGLGAHRREREVRTRE